MSELLAHSADDPERPRGKSAAAFRTISEVASVLDVPQHVLRFWETRFPQIKPLKRGGGRRYYRPEDVALLQDIRRLLYSEGYTIKGVQRLLREKGGLRALRDTNVSSGDPESAPIPEASIAKPALPESVQRTLRAAIAELEILRDALNGKGYGGH